MQNLLLVFSDIFKPYQNIIEWLQNCISYIKTELEVVTLFIYYYQEEL